MAADTDGASLRTLIVDDEPLAVERMQIICAGIPALSVIGTANDGAAALRLVEALSPDLILLDMTMPELDGTEVVREAWARGHRVPIVLISGYADFPLETRLEPGAYNGFLAKPFKLDDLIATIKRVLEAPS